MDGSTGRSAAAAVTVIAAANAAIASHSIAVSPGGTAAAVERGERGPGDEEVEEGVIGVVEKSLDELLEVSA